MGLACGCDDLAPSVFKEKFVKARKEYKCCECGKDISIGETYEYTFGVWEGVASSYHTCEKCADLKSSLSSLGFCLVFEELHEAHQEYLSEYAPPKLTLNG